MKTVRTIAGKTLRDRIRNNKMGAKRRYLKGSSGDDK